MEGRREGEKGEFPETTHTHTHTHTQAGAMSFICNVSVVRPGLYA